MVFNYLTSHGVEGFFILSSVILCATGGEALYADMGHMGREPIIRAWYLVFICPYNQLSRAGRIPHDKPRAHNILFEMIFSESKILYIPFLILSIAATVIASQAMISGIFSVVYQGITTRIIPLFKIEYTSTKLRSQIYIDVVNWFMLCSVLFVMLIFRSSNNLTLAYGLAVSGTMAITGILIIWIFLERGDFGKFLVAFGVLVVNLLFFFSTLHKIPAGGYWSLIFASFPCAVILIYVYGQRTLCFHSAGPV